METVQIFYADDDPDDLDIFNDAVQKINKELRIQIILHTFRDGAALLDELRSPIPDNCLILLDINMPVKTGLDILKEIRSDRRSKTLPVVICSTSAENQIIHLCHEAGANLYTIKPNDFNTLLAIINNIIRMTRSGWPTDPGQFVLTPKHL
jgi:CheY-like chemotaxis protein